MSVERAEAFNFFGSRTLVGPELKPGDTAPEFTLVTNKLEEVTLDTYRGKPLLISVVPSLDTSVCSKQTIRFNEEAASMKNQVNFIIVSADLPFAQSRWCGSNNASHMQTLSDHRDMSFGAAYGTLVKDFRIESRAVFIVNAEGTIQYSEYVPVAGEEPNYDQVLQVLQTMLG
jgi:thiol peroxidase